MNFITKFEKFESSDKRLDTILAKISQRGEESLTAEERRFLLAYRDQNQEKVHQELIQQEHTLDNDQFKFIFDRIERVGDQTRYYGTFTLKKDSIITTGYAFENKNGQCGLETTKNLYDYATGYEIDDMIDEIIGTFS
jgi:hypothetical protein